MKEFGWHMYLYLYKYYIQMCIWNDSNSSCQFLDIFPIGKCRAKVIYQRIWGQQCHEKGIIDWEIEMDCKGYFFIQSEISKEFKYKINQ